ncbi:MAG: hypothetical protein ACLP4R_04735 [Solirubrobacteraceae bacterium]
MTEAERHERAVANTLGFAQEAAAKGDFAGALEWLGVVEIVDGALPAGWERKRALWLRGGGSADGRRQPPSAFDESAGARGGT